MSPSVHAALKRVSVEGMDPAFANVLKRSSPPALLQKSPMRGVLSRPTRGVTFPRRHGGPAHQEPRPPSLVGHPELLAAELGITRTRGDDLTPTVYSASDSSNLAGLNDPAWKRLASHAFLPHEVISLIEASLMSQDEVKTIGNLCGDDAQNFIDVIHEVPSPLLYF